MANYLDPAADTSNPDVPQDSQSTDSSKPGLRKAWDDWTARPENNAALLQFGIAMLQPHAPGQTSLGAAANALGEAGGASDRNVAAARAEENAASQREVESAKAAATTSNAASYGRQVDQGGGKATGGTSGVLRQQADFRKWLAKPEDTTGLTADPILGAISKSFPNIKTKADLLADPRALSAAQQLFRAQITTEPSDTGAIDPANPDSTPSSPPTAPQYSEGEIRYNAQGKGVQLRGNRWVPIN